MQNARWIVVIEDHPEHLDFIATLLRRAGYRVAPFRAARAALAHVERSAVDLVITDVFMPEIDGFEVLRALQALRPDLPLIAVSGAASPDPVHFLGSIKSLGAREVLMKPIDAAALLAAVANILAAGPGGH